MQKINIEEKVAIWLQHGDLVNKLFKESTKNKSECYELKSELFLFHPKTKFDPVLPTAEISTVERNHANGAKKLKRKLGAKPESQRNDLEELKATVTKTLQIIKSIAGNESTNTFNKMESSSHYRCWEEVHNFPKFKGANHTNEFQHFSFGEQIYLIPPRCNFYNSNIKDVNDILPDLNTYDLIVLDPPWRNKYIRRLKRHKQELGYQMLGNEELRQLPISKLIRLNTIVAVWCTNGKQPQSALINQLLPAWGLRLIHTLKWFKINTSYELINDINDVGNKQPFEMLYIACHKENNSDFKEMKEVEHLFSIPSIVHSHKPPIFKLLSKHLPEEPQCLEFFARYLQPRFTCIGLEVLKLMDERLYRCIQL